jgi:uncharacterized protein DUF6519
MGADVSRVRFDPLRDFAGVVLQQGRLLLDGDFNEYVALLDRRLRAETCDLASFGPDPDHAGVAWVPRATPDGFRVTASGGDLTIGRGRMYVDGLLAENHGKTPTGFDPILSERTGTADLRYEDQDQVYWPTPDPLPTGGPHLAYLDVWEREVTYLEDPGLVEIAVDVDTTARLQTVWQVRLLPNIGNASCSSDDKDIPGWLDVIRPSAGRLTTDTITVAPTDDPCALPPSGGYRGLENQTYRVEVHDGGPPGTATFKWSRDNGSVAVPIVEMLSPTVLRLATVGRDDVLRVSPNDWVEILDDHYELGQKPGVLRKVTVDDAARTITFTGALPADLQPADATDAATRHLRVRRWDQAGSVKDGAGNELVDLDTPGAGGTITVPASGATQVQLESGIVVSFSLAAGGSGRFRPGDHWVFAARTADTSIEKFDAAPPLGIHHHYARLGTVTFPAGQSDCRRLWPPLGDGQDCDCTVCVTADSHSSGALTIQAAVDQVKAAGGGTVCLEAGVFELREPVNADGAVSLRIHGQGIGTLVVAAGTALTATGTRGLTLERLAILSGAGEGAAIRLRAALLADLHDLAVLSYARAKGGGSAIELSGVQAGVSVRRNVLVGQTALDGTGGGELGVLAAALRIEDNVAVGFDRGIDLGGRSAYVLACRIDRNELLAGTAGAVTATGAVLPGAKLTVNGNTVMTSGAGATVGPDATVEGNTVAALPLLRSADGAAARGTDGIVIAAGDFTPRAGNVRVSGNRVENRSGTAIALRAPVQAFVVTENVVATAGTGIAVQGDGAAERVLVAENEVFDVEVADADGATGIGIVRAQSVSVVGNTVARVGLDLPEARVRAGILVLGSGDVRVRGNLVDGVGPVAGFTGLAIGIGVLGPFEVATALDNSSRFSADATNPPQGSWIALLVEATSGRPPTSFGNKVAVVPVSNGSVFFTDAGAYLRAAAPEHATLSANTLAGGGATPAFLVGIRGDLVADGNQTEYAGSGEAPQGVRLGAETITASTNRLRGTRSLIALQVDPKRFAAVANLAPLGTHLADPGGSLTNLPAPWDALNPSIP